MRERERLRLCFQRLCLPQLCYSAAQFTTATYMCKYLLKTTITALILVYCSLLAAGKSVAIELEIQLENNRFPGETLYLAIYRGDSAAGWQSQTLAQLSQLLPDTTDFTLTLELPEGKYAARAFIDLSRNGKLDTTDAGRPEEPFAISIGTGRRKPSHRFHTAIFSVTEQGSPVRLQLHYPSMVTPASDTLFEPSTGL